MQRIFYTQEGSKYIIKTANKYTFPVNIVAPANIQIFAMIKPDGTHSSGYNNITINTSKKIIPIGFTFSLIESGVYNTVDISSVYTSIMYNQGLTPRPASNSTYLAKMIPYVKTDFFTNNLLYAQRYKYEEIVYSDSDFTETSNSITIFSSMSQSGALTGLGTIEDQLQIPIGNYNGMITFTYFEML
jgi:hypothetical protein